MNIDVETQSRLEVDRQVLDVFHQHVRELVHVQLPENTEEFLTNLDVCVISVVILYLN